MNRISHVKAYLSEAVTLIRNFESRLAEHHHQPHFEWRHKAYARRGVLGLPDGKIRYWFHGTGCTLRYNDILIDYDYARFIAPPGKCPILFSPWKFARTVQSLEAGHPIENVLRSDEEMAAGWLHVLEVEGLLSKLPQHLASYVVDEAALRRASDLAQ